MNSAKAAETAKDTSRLEGILSEWYALNPDVKQLWVYEAGETGTGDIGGISVIVELTPACDSDDIGPVWLARCIGWQRSLQGLIGRKVHLDWHDGSREPAPCAEVRVYARASLLSIAWREMSL